MFFYALRGNLGLRIMVSVFLIWNLYFLVSVYTGIIWLSALLMLVAVIVTCYGSFVLWQHRDEVVFASPLAREVAFPSSRKNGRLDFYVSLICGLPVCLVPVVIATVPPTTSDLEHLPAFAYVLVLVSLSGINGIVHHCVREAMDRKAAAIK